MRSAKRTSLLNKDMLVIRVETAEDSIPDQKTTAVYHQYQLLEPKGRGESHRIHRCKHGGMRTTSRLQYIRIRSTLSQLHRPARRRRRRLLLDPYTYEIAHKDPAAHPKPKRLSFRQFPHLVLLTSLPTADGPANNISSRALRSLCQLPILPF